MTGAASPEVFVILGYPLVRTLSPAMHNAAFCHLGINAVYLPLRVQHIDLELAIKALRTFDWRGGNVTMPHKESIIKYLGELSAEAKLVGAVNTIINREGQLFGYNTDVTGFSRSFPLDPGSLQQIVVVGAGGAARAVIAALLLNNASRIVILNRTLSRAVSTAQYFAAQFSRAEVLADDFSGQNWRYLCRADCIINCTPVDYPFPIQWLEKQLFAGCQCAYDLRYGLRNNKFLQLAAAQGVPIVIDGSEMLLQQAVEAFELWTDCQAPLEVMRAVVYQ